MNKYMKNPAEYGALAKDADGNAAAQILILNKAGSLVSKFMRIFGVIEGMDEVGFSGTQIISGQAR